MFFDNQGAKLSHRAVQQSQVRTLSVATTCRRFGVASINTWKLKASACDHILESNREVVANCPRTGAACSNGQQRLSDGPLASLTVVGLTNLGLRLDASDVLNGRRLDPNGTLMGLGLRIAMPVDSIGLYGPGGLKPGSRKQLIIFNSIIDLIQGRKELHYFVQSSTVYPAMNRSPSLLAW